MDNVGVCAMVSAMNCVRQMIHRHISLKQIIHYMLIRKKKEKKEGRDNPGLCFLKSCISDDANSYIQSGAGGIG